MSNTLFTGKVYLRFDELPSTNDQAASLLADGAPDEGTVIRADFQSAGRGQMGAQWWSRPGENLLLSIIYYPTFLAAGAQFYLSMSIALGLYDMVRKTLPDAVPVFIKWPNDLYIGDWKVGGILIQNTISGVHLQSSVIGIGLNVNQREFPEQTPYATSLANVAGRFFSLDTLAETLFSSIENRYLQLKAGNLRSLHAEYERLLWRRGVPASYLRLPENQTFEAVLLGVTEQGLLRLDTAGGEVCFDLKKVGFARVG
jgi:BirA family biotin operon repressor/biotin-[acetyl-CoA-carboxylase] ligase